MFYLISLFPVDFFSSGPPLLLIGLCFSPSMGSSFSDLDDASVTQSALEEALMSNMGNTTTTIPGAGMASRVSGISQALRSRYFDAQSRGAGGAQGQGER